jgi:hypothetical protein
MWATVVRHELGISIICMVAEHIDQTVLRNN